jgi:hypothetical protein
MDHHQAATTGLRDQGQRFAAASLAICGAVAVYDFSLRERHVLELVRVQSFGAGRTEAYIPGLRFFAAATRISCGNVSRVIADLKRKHVIEECPQSFYGFIIPCSAWRVPVRTESIEVIEQLLLLERPPHLGSALRLTFAEQCNMEDGAHGVTRPAPVTVTCQPGCETPDGSFPIREFPNREAATRMQALQPCKLALRQDYKDPSLQDCTFVEVPESGMPPARPARVAAGRLDAERQEIFDELRKVGALGRQEESLPNWLDFVRRRPHVAQRLLGELRYRQLTEQVRNPGAWMMSQWMWWGRPEK